MANRLGAPGYWARNGRERLVDMEFVAAVNRCLSVWGMRGGDDSARGLYMKRGVFRVEVSVVVMSLADGWMKLRFKLKPAEIQLAMRMADVTVFARSLITRVYFLIGCEFRDHPDELELVPVAGPDEKAVERKRVQRRRRKRDVMEDFEEQEGDW